jgi:gamma-glutamylcyclotransferase (GGCT)/AIG2-like uncharacterized protein YtfP
MKNIFVYGSLMFDDVWGRIVHHRYEKKPALLPGYKRLSVKGESYPGLVKSFNSSVDGEIYFNVTAQDIRRLDKFEGSYYKKIPVTVIAEYGHAHKASTYLFIRHKRRLLSTRSWDPLRFQAKYLSKFITRYNGF